MFAFLSPPPPRLFTIEILLLPSCCGGGEAPGSPRRTPQAPLAPLRLRLPHPGGKGPLLLETACPPSGTRCADRANLERKKRSPRGRCQEPAAAGGGVPQPPTRRGTHWGAAPPSALREPGGEPRTELPHPLRGGAGAGRGGTGRGGALLH